MSTLLSIGFALLVLNTLVGMVANGFIVLFIVIDWVRSRKLSQTDLILGCLGLSRFLWQMVVILHVTIDSFFKHVYLQVPKWTAMTAVWVFINSVSLWFAAWLSILYFVKVAIFSHPVFLQMKQRISGLTPWLLLSSVAFCAAVTVITTIWKNVFTCSSYPSSNSTDSTGQNTDFCKYYALLLIAPNIIPFMLFLLPSFFLISSLWKHVRSLRSNGIGVNDLSTQGHLTAIKALASFAVLYLTSFVAAIWETVSITEEPYDRFWTPIILKNVGALYPSGHAIILVLINPKLKLGWMRMLHHFKCCLREAPS